MNIHSPINFDSLWRPRARFLAVLALYELAVYFLVQMLPGYFMGAWLNFVPGPIGVRIRLTAIYRKLGVNDRHEMLLKFR
jgi:hypothetical protein